MVSASSPGEADAGGGKFLRLTAEKANSFCATHGEDVEMQSNQIQATQDFT